MAKRKITVTVDEELVQMAHELGEDKLSTVVNAALASHVERLGRLASLRELLARWDAELGEVPRDVQEDARAAFDEFVDQSSLQGK